jgi:gliding motility-associated-like protein
MLAGLYYDTLADIHTCDSVIVDTLRDYPVYRTSGMHFYACHGMGLNIHGHYRSSSGIYADTLFSSYRCDSLLFDTLSILPISIVPGYTVFTCPGHAVNMHGSMHTHAGEYLDTQIIAGSCDTIFRDSLINYPIYLISGINYHICPGDSIAWNGNYYSSAQLLYDSLLSFNGCDSIIVDSLKWNPLPEANAGADQLIFTGEITTLHGAGGPPFFWSNGVMDSANEVSPLADTFYVLSVINDSGCISRDTVFVRVKAKAAIVKVPDAFTPNADGLNDRFTVFAQGIKTYEISIFNRWGELIYFSNDLSELNNTGRGWDGNFLGTPQQSNTFIFLIKATGEDNKLIQEQGTLSLIR